MGGYGALLYATLLELGAAVVFWPQVNKKDSPGVAKKIGKRWRNLDEVVALSHRAPAVSLFFGALAPDQMGAYLLIDALRQKDTHVLFHHAAPVEHNLFPVLHIDRRYIDKEIEYLDREVVLLDEVKA
jgi:hypothetical protein